MPNIPGMDLPGFIGDTPPQSYGRLPIGDQPVANLDGGGWFLPVIGMSNSPSQFQPGGSPGWATGSYGYQKPQSKGGHTHAGVDIYAQKGAQIISPVNGVVKVVGTGSTSGNYVKIQGDDGNEYYFAHMDSVHPGLSQGMRISGGELLGGVGNTGNAEGTENHLHFEVRRGGRSVNPNEFLTNGQTRDTTPLSAIAGLNTVAQLQSYIDEQVRAATFMNQDTTLGFDPRSFDQSTEISPEDLQRAQTKAGQTMLGQTMDAMSQTLSGGNRVPMARVSSAMDAVEGGKPVPSASEQRQRVTEDSDATR